MFGGSFFFVDYSHDETQHIFGIFPFTKIIRPISDGFSLVDPIVSMGLVYLATFPIKINHSCRYIYRSSHGSYGDGTSR